MSALLRGSLRSLALVAGLMGGVSAAAVVRAQAPPTKAEATITVVVPADAEVFFDKFRTQMRGTERLFTTPPLPTDQTLFYAVLARWQVNGKPVEHTRKIAVRGGGSVRVDFLTPQAQNQAQGSVPKGTPAPTVARVSGPVDGVLLERAPGAAGWQFLDDGAPVRADALLVALPQALLQSANGNVQLKMIADIGHRGPLPVYESAVRIHDNPKVDLDFSLDRGIAGFGNGKPGGPARVRVHVAGQAWDVTLPDPGAQVGLEIYGRQPPGEPHFVTEGGRVTVKEPPTREVYLLVLKGRAVLHTADQEFTLEAPPGPALMHWDTVARKYEVTRLDKLPESLQPTTPEEVKKYQTLCANVRKLRDGPLDAMIEKALQGDEPLARTGAVVVLGALDKLPRLLDVLGGSKYADERDKSITVLRNWVGRGPGQLEKLYDFLISDRKLTPVQARTAIHLLLGFNEEEMRQPETYEVLIDLLKHSKLAVRELARWHLVRLAPEGKKIDYDAAAPPEQRDLAVAQWRALIPAGQLPPQLRAQPENKK
jgi:uncharacterized protein (TIGR03000 family)